MTKEQKQITYQGIIELTLVLITVAGLFLWNRSESNADRNAIYASIESNRKESQAQIGTIRKESQAQIEAIREDGKIFREEMANIHREFHGRLIQIETERNMERRFYEQSKS